MRVGSTRPKTSPLNPVGLLGLLLATGLLVAGTVVRADSIPIPNSSFESPAILFVNTHVDSWEKAPKPPDYDESGGYTWEQLTGVFKNTAPGAADHLDNCDGNQALWLFAVPGAGLFQDYDSLDWNTGQPSHAFNAVYEVGKSYHLTVGLLGGGGNMVEGAGVELCLYYRDASSNQVAVALTTVVHSRDSFPNRTHLTDFSTHSSFVKAGDPWAGRQVGVLLRSAVNPDDAGGYWDVDNVRLTVETAPAPTPTVLSVSQSGSNLRVAWPSINGYQYQLRVSDDLQQWRDLDQPVSGSGEELVKLVPIDDRSAAYFGVLSAPAP